MKVLASLGTTANDFRRMANLGTGVAGFLLLAPFAINNLAQERFLMGAGSSLIVVLLAFNAWSIFRGRFYPTMISVVLVPAILVILALSIHNMGIVGILWCYPAVLAFYIMLPERKAWTANLLLIAIVVAEVWSLFHFPIATRVVATLLAVSIFSAIFVRVIATQQRRLEAKATTDPLTGLSNRMLLPTSLEQASQQGECDGTPMTLLTIDVDHFKSINDTFGHGAGDEVLRGIGALLRGRTRRSDSVYRLGGEEFLVVLRSTAHDNALRIAEEIRAAIESHDLLAERSVTVSIGVATLRDDEDWSALMKRSDSNLYKAKTDGRNCVFA